VPGEGWAAWGAASRTEWTYVAAVHLALEYATQRWAKHPDGAAPPQPTVAPESNPARRVLSEIGRRRFLVATAAVGLSAGVATLWASLSKRSIPGDQLVTSSRDIVTCVAFSPDGRTLACSQGNQLWLWDLAAARPRLIGGPLTGHSDTVNVVAFSPDGHMLASGSDDTTVRLWNVTELTRPRPIGNPLLPDTYGVTSVAFSPDGHTLANSTAGPGRDFKIRQWNVANPNDPVAIGLRLESGGSAPVSFSPNGHVLATGDAADAIRLWDVTSPAGAVLIGQATATIGNDGDIQSLTFSPDGHMLATAGYPDTVRLWDVTDPAHPVPMGDQLTGHTDTVKSVAFSPDGHTLASGSLDQTIRLWDVVNPDRPTLIGQPLSDSNDGVYSVAFAPNGRTLASGTANGTIRLWPVG
jgi:WD40 repeat protein